MTGENSLLPFEKRRVELAREIFSLYNCEVFGNALPQDMTIDWNPRLRKTAGFCYSKRVVNRQGVESRSARLELSTKIVDREDRLRKTLVHEMCHAVSWLIDGYREGHGPKWKAWGEKATRKFPSWPVEGRCHNYKVETKYTYRCTQCGYSIGRHSKSLDTSKKVCGKCFGSFEILIRKTTSKTSPSALGTNNEENKYEKVKSPNAFAKFVKENYHTFKKDGREHKEIMNILSKKFALTKEKKSMALKPINKKLFNSTKI